MGRALSSCTFELSQRRQLQHARSCLDPSLGHRRPDAPTLECYPAPAHIDQQRKAKRRCLGVHAWPVTLPQSVEVLDDRAYYLGLSMEYEYDGGEPAVVETVWGGGGQEVTETRDAGLRVRFTRCCRAGVRSSATGGQIPFLFYM